MVTLIDRLGIPIRSKINNKNVYQEAAVIKRALENLQDAYKQILGGQRKNIMFYASLKE